MQTDTLGQKKLASCLIENYCQAWQNMKTGLEIHSEADGKIFTLQMNILINFFDVCIVSFFD